MTSEGTIQKVSLKPSQRIAAEESVPFVSPCENEPFVMLGAARTETELFSQGIQPSASSLFGPRGAALLESGGSFWVSDTGHHRLLGWKQLPKADGQAADWCIGQPDFHSEGRNGKSNVSACSVNVPVGICGLQGGMAVADSWNHRVLIWKQAPEGNNIPADIVLGQSDFESNEANHGLPAAGADTMYWPSAVYYASGKFFVADTGNRRVLIWNDIPSRNGQPADLVLGQKDFSCRDENGGAAPSAASMRWPHAISLVGDQLFIADAGNNRVMIWQRIPTENGAKCDLVLGQKDFENSEHNCTSYWPLANSLNMPYGLTSTSKWILVADTANSRVLGWDVNAITSGGRAGALLGQRNLHEKGDNRWGDIASDSICWPYSLGASGEHLIICDSGNNRVSLWRLTP